MFNDVLWTSYANTVLQIGAARHLEVDLRHPLSDAMRRSLSELGLGSSFAVVTAQDPAGRRTSVWHNWWRHLRFRFALARRGLRAIPADGTSPDGSHRERGFAVDLGRSDAKELAAHYGQLALYWFDGDAFWLDGVLALREPCRLP